jgi:hypothetical protein
VAASTPAPARTATATSSVHQVAASAGRPASRRRRFSGCSSAVSSSAAMNGSTTIRSALASRKAR